MPGEVDTAAGPTEDARPAPIFEGVHFALIPSDDLKGEVEDQVSEATFTFMRHEPCANRH